MKSINEFRLRMAEMSSTLKMIQGRPDFFEVTSDQGFVIDLRYATPNNFVGENMYGDLKQAYLHREAANKLLKARDHLRRLQPESKIIVYDALRPRSVQFRLWEKVRGTDQEIYVADPARGSVHNFGFAVDVSILDGHYQELDMGTPFDSFTELAQPLLEEQMFRVGRLSLNHLNNRRLLRTIMEDAGFIQQPQEWWHFDALPKSEVVKRYQIIE